ncbi:hypothetical protein [Methanogenium organophilum]|uniref:Uncharacterized protein n=1 Tax=Methanogenium organophilum TaxID=2199 RepID=A0A9X9S3U5_METOG|nr:hypothetical protein [Methanogenium organophilum]WAI00982.1 hypothetical protein OU421_11255 [Methanogenium organophilum]
MLIIGFIAVISVFDGLVTEGVICDVRSGRGSDVYSGYSSVGRDRVHDPDIKPGENFNDPSLRTGILFFIFYG